MQQHIDVPKWAQKNKLIIARARMDLAFSSSTWEAKTADEKRRIAECAQFWGDAQGTKSRWRDEDFDYDEDGVTNVGESPFWRDAERASSRWRDEES
jgi:hypothetical protein